MASLRPIIYTPSGRAGEFANHGVAVNVYKGCTNGCAYCFNCAMPWVDREKFRAEALPVQDCLSRLDRDLRGGTRFTEPVFLCFACDPYPDVEAALRLTRRAIEIIKASGNCVRILTKNPLLATRDLDLLGEGDEFGTTLTFSSVVDSLRWEPKAEVPPERIEALRIATERGIRTWVSIEPVIFPQQSLEVIRRAHRYVDVFKVGILNHAKDVPAELRAELPEVDWAAFGRDAVSLMADLNCSYVLKNDLRERMGARCEQ